MKPFSLLTALVLTIFLPARSQLLGIFEQGAQELREYGQQLAALELLLNRQHSAYQVFESGLNSISSITGGELTLHQTYYTSLATPNPEIAGSPQLAAFVSMQSKTTTDWQTALARWQTSQYLTSAELAYVAQVTAAIIRTIAIQVSSFNMFVSDNILTMSDNERMKELSTACRNIQSLYIFSHDLIDEIDMLIINRRS